MKNENVRLMSTGDNETCEKCCMRYLELRDNGHNLRELETRYNEVSIVGHKVAVMQWESISARGDDEQQRQPMINFMARRAKIQS